jgi:hypothetical protein
MRKKKPVAPVSVAAVVAISLLAACPFDCGSITAG